MLFGLTAILALGLSSLHPQATLRGRVLDAQTEQPIAQVAVFIDGASAGATDQQGEFLVTIADPHPITLMLTAMGYGLVRRSLTLASGANDAGTISLNRESAGITERVTVIGTAGGGSASARTLTKSDLQALKMVLIDDPLRSVHALPGVVANRDLRSDFELRGAGFDQIGVYLDGVLTGGFVHVLTDSGSTDRLSLSVLNQDTIGSARLLPGVTDAGFGYATAGVLDLQTREGNREKTSVGGSTGFVANTIVAEGPMRAGAGSWLLAGRTTRYNYLHDAVARMTNTEENSDDDSTLEISDINGKGVFDVAPHHQAGLFFLAGVLHTDLGPQTRTLYADSRYTSGVARARSSNWLGSGNWKYTPAGGAFTEVRAFALGSGYLERNVSATPLADNGRTSVGLRADGSWLAAPRHVVQAGLYLQQVHEHGYTAFIPDAADAPLSTSSFDAHRLEASVYVQDTWSAADRLSMTGGLRLAREGGTSVQASPKIRATWSPAVSWTVRAAAGVQRQPPPLATLFGVLGNRHLRSPRSTEVDAGLEHALSDRVSVTVDVYRRWDHDQIFSFSEPRAPAAGRPFQTDIFEAYRFENSVEAIARGIDLAIRRSTASRLGGWLSYAYGRANAVDAGDGLAFPTDADQRHTVNLFGNVRLTATIGVSALWRYGSGTPHIGFIDPVDGVGFSTERNQRRLAPYRRVDLRANKVFVVGGLTWTVSAEVLNALNDRNEYNIETPLTAYVNRGAYGTGTRRSPGAVPSLGLTIHY